MRSDGLLLQDALEAIDEVIESTPADWEAFEADKFRRSHVIRQIQIIGEVAWRLSDGAKEKEPDVPWHQIAGMRHVLVHDYFQVNWVRVWQTACQEIPPLRPRIEAMIAALALER